MICCPRRHFAPSARRGVLLRACGAAAVAVFTLLLVSAASAASAPAEAGAAATQPQETVFSLAVKGGWLMIPIGLCSVVVLTWTIERLITLRASRVFSPGLLEAVFDTIPSRRRNERAPSRDALEACQAADTIVGRVVGTGVEKLHRDESHAQLFLEEAAAKEIHVLKRSLRPFEVCVAVAPLLGLLGTVLGMISCFEKAALADTASRADTLASGIYVALVTTAAGLCVAIPALLVHHYFLGRIDRIQDTVEETASEFLDHYYGTAVMKRLRQSSVGPHGSGERPEPPRDSVEPIGTGP